MDGLAEHVLKIAAGLRVVGPDFECPLKLGNGLVGPVQAVKGAAKVVVSLGVVGVDSDRLLKLGPRLVEAALGKQNGAKVVANLGVVRVDSSAPPEERRQPRRAFPVGAGLHRG